MDNHFPIKNIAMLSIGGLFALVFAAMGVDLGRQVLDLACKELQTRSWIETPCQILVVEMLNEIKPGRPFDRFRMEYRYEWQNTFRIGTEVSRLSGYDGQHFTPQQMFEAWDELGKTAQATRCWVNPNNPIEAVLIRDARWDFVMGQTLAAMAFSGGCGWGLALILFSVSDQLRRSVRNFSTIRPWESRPDWASGTIVDSDRRTVLLLIGIALWFLTISISPFLTSLRAILQGNRLAYLGLSPGAITLIFCLLASRSILRWRRFGDSILTLGTIPGVVGGELLGVICPQRLTESPQGYELLLRCTESEDCGDDETRTKIAWEEVRYVKNELQTPDSNQFAIPVLIPIPLEAPSTLEGPISDYRRWTLYVRSLTPGHGYRARFEVPVFRTLDSQGEQHPESETAQQVLLPVDSLDTIRAAGIIVETVNDHHLRFIFPACRNLTFHVTIVFAQAIFAAIAAALLYVFWPLGWFWSAISLGVLVVGSLIDRLSFRSQVDVGLTGLTIRSGRLLFGLPIQIALDDIGGMYWNEMGTIGSLDCVNIYIQRKRGWPILIAKYVIPANVAEYIRTEIKTRTQSDR